MRERKYRPGESIVLIGLWLAWLASFIGVFIVDGGDVLRVGFALIALTILVVTA
jgi:hypothetical protein